MNFGAAKGLLKSRMSRASGISTTLDSQILAEFNAAIQELEEGPVFPYFLEDDIIMTLPAGDYTAALDSSILELADTPPLFVKGEERIPLKRMPRSLMDVDPRFGNRTTLGEPRYYDFAANHLYLAPTPEVAITVELFLYKKDALITSDSTENLWLKYAPSLLIAKVGMILSGGAVKNPDGYAFFSNEYRAAYARMLARNTVREYGAYDMGLTE